MATESLVDAIRQLRPEDQELVRRFVESLKQREPADRSPFLDAADEFIASHPELLQRLAR